MAASPVDQAPSKGRFRERYVQRAGHRIYVRDYPGEGPAYVMVHGFPDNCRIYADIASRLSAAGRRVVAFDFLGFGASDKPDGFSYSFEQQLADLTAVVDDLGPIKVIPVGHDAGGPAAINYAVTNRSRVASLVLFNCYYANSPVLAFPDFIELCCNPKTRLLAVAMMTDPKQAAYLFQFQQEPIRAHLTPEMRERFDTVLQPIIAENFSMSPSSMPAMLAMTGNAYENLAANDLRLPVLGSFDKPLKLIWGSWDRYLNIAVAKDLAAHFPNASLTALEAEHWPQFDQPDQVVRTLLAS
ncbi:alpha/beta fold hydrolase [Methylobacterium brachythecii]|uniref:Pimeloyl-ACP methyl ester carboxylesterase n=1 Tax=Methylobacterium brachythecii TaxID=1176177 RepID=A0A7W6F7P1_9HYPH|nr:alpha/beta hydrolase [Methylobacterium brachythecii]MBB3903667.1 pimeloyl-ACP methyl ester carboxylesterase [Methylobacterium brachythecii]